MRRIIINYPSIVFLTVLLSLFAGPHDALSEMRSKNKILAGTPPFEIVKNIIGDNSIAADNYTAPKENFAPYITWLTDPDVRIQPRLIMKSPENRLYTCRNMGAQLEVSGGEIEYGVRHLHTPILLITLASDSSAVRFFMEGYTDMAPSIRRELDHLSLPMAKDSKKGDFQERLIQNVEANIDFQVARAVSLYRDRIDMGRLAVIGSVADFANVYKRGAGRLIIVNVNGETEDAKLRTLPMMTSISPSMRKISIGRERIKPAEVKPEN